MLRRELRIRAAAGTRPQHSGGRDGLAHSCLPFFRKGARKTAPPGTAPPATIESAGDQHGTDQGGRRPAAVGSSGRPSAPAAGKQIGQKKKGAGTKSVDPLCRRMIGGPGNARANPRGAEMAGARITMMTKEEVRMFSPTMTNSER